MICIEKLQLTWVTDAQLHFQKHKIAIIVYGR